MSKRKFIHIRSHKKKTLFLSLLACLFLLGVGYANLETILGINGTVGVSKYFTYSIDYSMNGGQGFSTYPINSSANGVIEISKPTKTFTLNYDVNSQGATIQDGNGEDIISDSNPLNFAGWTATGINTSTAKYGLSRDAIANSWNDGTVAVGADDDTIYFKSLGGSASPVTLTANWEEEIITLPILEKTGYTCSFNTELDGSGTSYASAGTYTITNASTSDTLYVICVDDTPPVIVSATASSTSDISNYVEFNATDAGSGIVGYNLSTDGVNAPSNWIPVVSTMATTTETKYDLGASWARVFHHNNHWGTTYFANSTTAQSSNEVDRYSVLGSITNYKSSNFEFLLEYPEISTSQYNRWTQTDNPVTTTIANGDGSAYAGGYNAVHIDWTSSYWGGLTLSTADTSTFINGSVGHGNWFYAIGTYSPGWNGGMPGPASAVSIVDLWARIDTLATSTSVNLTRRVNVKNNGTYYLWVKDSEGNTNKTAVTVSNVTAICPITTAYSGTYDGNAHGITVSGGSGGTVQYSSNNTNWQNTNITRTSAGSQTTYVRVVGDSNHNTVTCLSKTITINKKATTMSLSSTSGTIACNGTANITVTTDGDGTISCSTSNSSVATCSVSNKTVTVTGKGSGSATITVSQAAGTNYNATSKTYSATGSSCVSWIFDDAASYDGGSVGTCQWYCPRFCPDYYSTSIWSCTASNSVAPTAPSLLDGKWCWCGK